MQRMDSTLLSSVMLLAVVCLFGLNGSAWSQGSPCPDVFSYKEDPDLSKTYGLIELRNLSNSTTIRLNVELSYHADVDKQNMTSIKLVKSSKQTLRDISNNQPVLYRVDFPPTKVLPAVLAIIVNGETICSGQSVKLEHTVYTPVQKSSNGSSSTTTTTTSRPTTQSQQPSQVIKAEELQVANISDDTCGKVGWASGRSRRALKGISTIRGQFPWVAPVFRVSDMHKPQFICGSTIISTRCVLTAASCLFAKQKTLKPDELSVVPGMYNIDSFFEKTNQLRYVAHIHVRSEFVHGNFDELSYNIAALKLNEPVEFNDMVRPICLWDGTDKIDELVGQQGYEYGWGITEKWKVPKEPSYVKATVIDKQECSRKLGKLNVDLSQLFCADANGSVSCDGDVGNGLVFQRGARFYLRGIVVFAASDFRDHFCDTKMPAGYTDVARFRVWIAGILKM